MPQLKNKNRELTLGTLYRSVEFDRASIDTETRTVELSFSSDTPIERGWGIEILDHGAKSVRLDRMKAGGPLLLDHDRSTQIGVIEKISIKNGRGNAIARFGKGARAEEIFQDVIDGIRRSISAGYRVHSMTLVEEKNGVNTYRITDWEPLEISVVSVPADMSVGIGRSDAPQNETEIIDERNLEMPDKLEEEKKQEIRDIAPAAAVDVEQIRRTATDDARRGELERIVEIQALGDKLGLREIGDKAIGDGTSIDDFRKIALEEVTKSKLTPVDLDLNIGMSQREVKRFSLMRAINAMATGKWAGAEFERECSDAVAAQVRKTPQGIFIPHEIQTRDLTKGVATAGGNLIATDLLSGSFIDMLRNRMMVKEMGATIMGGLVGDMAIPRQTGGATGYWVAESGAPTESQQAFDQVAMTPKTCGAFTDISRKLLLQSSVDVENFVQGDLAKVLALMTDLAGISGSGSSNQPKGILNVTGIGDVAGGTNGATPTWGNIVQLETEVTQSNADIGTLGYLSNAKVRGKLKTVDKASGAAQFIWEKGSAPGLGEMNGYKAGVSNQVPSNLTKGSSSVASAIIFGNWADLVIGMWGALDVLIDPYTGGSSGTVRVRVLQDIDIVVRHPESFAAMQDALTA